MPEAYNKALKADFIDSFMVRYKPLLGKEPYNGTAYDKPYVITESRACFKVTANNKTKRFSSLYAAANFIYDMNFDVKKTCVKVGFNLKNEALERVKAGLELGELWTSLTSAVSTKSSVKPLRKFNPPRASYSIGLTV